MNGAHWRKGWPAVLVGGVLFGVLASFPSLDGALWRFVVFVAPWSLVLVVPLVGAAAYVVFWKGRGW